MARLPDYATLTSTDLAAGDKIPLSDVSASSATKNILASGLLQGLLVAASNAVLDANGNELFKLSTTSSAVNELTIANAATGNNPVLSATGGDTNVGITLTPKGSGAVVLSGTTLRFPSAGIIADVNGNELIKFPSTVASAVNEITVTNAATGGTPSVAATGGDTNISFDVIPKGTGIVRDVSLAVQKVTQTATTDTATITIAQMLTGVLDATPTAAAAYTLPTAADLVAGIPGARVGDSFSFLINNKSGGANTVTVGAGSGGTADGTLTVAQHVIRRFTIIVTNVTGSSEAYVVYGEGA